MFARRCASVVALVLSALAPSAASAQWASLTPESPANGTYTSSSSIDIQYKACSNTWAQITWPDEFSQSSIDGSECPGFSEAKRYTGTVSLSVGWNQIAINVCNSDATPHCVSDNISVFRTQAAVTVTPDAGTSSSIQLAASGSTQFHIQNTGNVFDTAHVTFSCGANVSGCALDSTDIELSPGQTKHVMLSYNGAGIGTAALAVTASYLQWGSSDGGSSTVTVNPIPVASVVITMTGADTIGIGATFTTSATARTYAAGGAELTGRSVSWSGTGLSSSPSSGSSPASVTVTGTSAGSRTLQATSEGINGTKAVQVMSPSYAITVSDAQTTRTIPARRTVDTISYTVTNTSSFSTDTLPLALSPVCTGVASPCNAFPNVTSLLSGGSATIKVIYDVSLSGSAGSMILQASAYPFSPIAKDTTSLSTTPSYQVAVEPKSASPYATQTIGERKTADSSQFLIRNTSTNTTTSVSVSVATLCGSVVSCGSSLTGGTFAPGDSLIRVIQLGVDTAGTTGSAKLTASISSPDSYSTDYTQAVATTPSYQVTVTPSESSQTILAAATKDTSYFTVTNHSWNTSGSIVFTLTKSCTGIATSCAVSNGTSTLAQGATSTTKSIHYNVSGTGTTGSATFIATASSPASFSGNATTTLVPTPYYAITILPQDSTKLIGAGATNTVSVKIKNSSRNTSSSVTAHLTTPGCSNVVVYNCSAPSSNKTLSQGSTSGTIVATLAGLALGTEQVVFSGTGSAAGTVAVTTGSVAATVSDSGHTWLTGNIMSGPTTERSDCVTISAGPGAAYECGELRLAHPLPPTMTMGKTHAPFLIYNSAFASPVVRVAANVTYTGARPSTIEATATLDAINKTRSFSFVARCDTATCRLEIPFQPNAAVTPTGAYAIQVWARSKSGSWVYDTSNTIADTAIIVNRSKSIFGAGWWLDGLETLVFDHVPAGRVLWVGGDGSTRLYSHALSDTAIYTVDPTYDRPDTLVHVDSVTWRRHLSDGAFVEFDATGRHARTVNALGWQTTFYWNGIKLDSLTLPVPTGGLRRTYQFTYKDTASTSILLRVTAPSTPAVRTVTTGRSSGFKITSLTDSGSAYVGFAVSSASNRVTSRTDPLGYVTTFTYSDSNKTLSKAELDMGSAGLRTLAFTAAEARSGGVNDELYPLAKVYTLYNGPRPGSDMPDTSAFWINRWGAPTRILSSVDSTHTQVTQLFRDDPAFPVLVTSLIAPNGLRTDAYFSERALLDSTEVFDPYGVGCGNRSCNAITRNAWHEKWNQIVATTGPTGDSISAVMDSIRPLVLATKVGANPDRATGFWYNDDGQLSHVKSPDNTISHLQDIDYDARLGNVKRVITPKGFHSLVFRDSIGQTVLSVSPTDTLSAKTDSGLLVKGRRDSTVFDIMGRPTWTLSSGADSTAAVSYLRVTTQYDSAGQVRNIVRTASNPLGSAYSLTTSWEYDGGGRQTRETAPTGFIEERRYDEGGNLTRIQGANGDTVSMRYDALGRIRKRFVAQRVYGARSGVGIASAQLEGDSASTGLKSYPYFRATPTDSSYTVVARTDTFSYGVDGLAYGWNADAAVSRAYYPNGALKTDSLHIMTWSRDSTHRYGLEHKYDLAGRQVGLKHPSQLAPTGTGARDSVVYAYDAQGQLSGVVDVMNQAFSFGYTLGGDLSRRSLPGSWKDSLQYDYDGQLVRNWLLHPELESMRDETIRRDAVGRALYDADSKARKDTVYATYGALGALARRYVKQPLDGAHYQGLLASYVVDGLGNRHQSGDTLWLSGNKVSETATTSSFDGLGRLATNTLSPSFRTDTTHYDSTGSQVFTYAPQRETGMPLTDRAMYYAPDGRLRATETRNVQSFSNQIEDWDVTFDEYRYDPLGRRVAMRTQRNCHIQAGIAPFYCQQGELRRTVWDGNAELYEIRRPWASAEVDTNLVLGALYGTPGGTFDFSHRYGRVAYTYGVSLDQPLSLTRIGFVGKYSDTLTTYAPITVVPHWNWRGAAESGNFTDGSLGLCGVNAECPRVPWRWQALPFEKVAISQDGEDWFGSLIEDKQDPSGLEFRRNRYLDNKAGQFTQEDPIGLAGGMNLYGFAGGDPITYSDPFGLSGCKNGEPCKSPVAEMVDQLNQGIKDAVASVAGAVLDVAAGVANAVTGLGDLYTAAGLNPSVKGAGARAAAGGMFLVGAVGANVGVSEGRAALGTLMGGEFRVMAGAGSGATFRAAGKLGGNAGDWQYVTSAATMELNGFRWQAHWARNMATGETAMAKLKAIGVVK